MKQRVSHEEAEEQRDKEDKVKEFKRRVEEWEREKEVDGSEEV